MDMEDAAKSFEEAILMLKHWGSYVDEHFKEKWGFHKDIESLEERVKKCRESHEINKINEQAYQVRIQRLYDMLEDKWW